MRADNLRHLRIFVPHGGLAVNTQAPQLVMYRDE